VENQGASEFSEHSDCFGQYLYDGDTRELLAFAQIQNGKKSGKGFDLHHPIKSFETPAGMMQANISTP
jgi:hypothetical protein